MRLVTSQSQEIPVRGMAMPIVLLFGALRWLNAAHQGRDMAGSAIRLARRLPQA